MRRFIRQLSLFGNATESEEYYAWAGDRAGVEQLIRDSNVQPKRRADGSNILHLAVWSMDINTVQIVLQLPTARRMILERTREGWEYDPLELAQLNQDVGMNRVLANTLAGWSRLGSTSRRRKQCHLLIGDTLIRACGFRLDGDMPSWVRENRSGHSVHELDQIHVTSTDRLIDDQGNSTADIVSQTDYFAHGVDLHWYEEVNIASRKRKRKQGHIQSRRVGRYQEKNLCERQQDKCVKKAAKAARRAKRSQQESMMDEYGDYGDEDTGRNLTRYLKSVMTQSYEMYRNNQVGWKLVVGATDEENESGTERETSNIVRPGDSVFCIKYNGSQRYVARFGSADREAIRVDGEAFLRWNGNRKGHVIMEDKWGNTRGVLFTLKSPLINRVKWTKYGLDVVQ
jgi:hypothetical protein